MGEEEGLSWPPTGAPLHIQRDDHWRHFDNSVNAVSFGFVATAILISMFLLMAIFERFLRSTSPALTPASGGRRHAHHDIESHSRIGFTGKYFHPSTKFLPRNCIFHSIRDIIIGAPFAMVALAYNLNELVKLHPTITRKVLLLYFGLFEMEHLIRAFNENNPTNDKKQSKGKRKGEAGTP